MGAGDCGYGWESGWGVGEVMDVGGLCRVEGGIGQPSGRSYQV